MNLFENVKFCMIKNSLTEGILKNICCSMEFYKHIFLTDRLHFNSIIDFNTDIVFFEDQNTYNITKRINFKPLTIEDFLYRSLEEIISEYKVYLNQILNELEENYNLNFYKLNVFHTSGGNVTSKEGYYN